MIYVLKGKCSNLCIKGTVQLFMYQRDSAVIYVLKGQWCDIYIICSSVNMYIYIFFYHLGCNGCTLYTVQCAGN